MHRGTRAVASPDFCFSEANDLFRLLDSRQTFGLRNLPPIINIDFLNWTLPPASGIVKSLCNLLCMQPLRSCFCFASLVCCTANLLTSLFFAKTEPAVFRLRARSVLATLTNRRFHEIASQIRLHRCLDVRCL